MKVIDYFTKLFKGLHHNEKLYLGFAGISKSEG